LLLAELEGLQGPEQCRPRPAICNRVGSGASEFRFQIAAEPSFQQRHDSMTQPGAIVAFVHVRRIRKQDWPVLWIREPVLQPCCQFRSSERE
jgi:hypothetical protein